MQVQSFTIDDFSGGITDYPMDATQNQCQTLDNVVINPNKKPISRDCFQIYGTADFQVPDGNVRIGALLPIETSAVSNLFVQSSRKIWYQNAGTFTELLGPSGNSALPAGTSSNFVSSAIWNNHMLLTTDAFGSVMKLYHNASLTPTIINAGLPDLASAPTVTAGASGSNSYIYAFIYDYTYNIGTVLFEDLGPTTQVLLSSASTPDVNAIAITAIPVLSNGSTENRDTTAITVQIYRTLNNGTQFFLVGSVTNGTTTFTDSVSDATLGNNQPLYINGGVLDNDPPPQCKYIHVVNGKTYYANIKDGTELLTNQVRESKAADPDSVPVENFDQVEDDIAGISSYQGKVVVFGNNRTYRLDGTFDELGAGGISHEAISPIIGCLSHRSIVQTRDGIFWAGQDGFYWTDGYRVQKVSDSINLTYKAFVNTGIKQGRIVGTYDKKENRVIWSIQNDPTNSDNDTFFILDLRWGVRPASTFVTASNGQNLSATALCFYQNALYHGDRRGYVFTWGNTVYSDPLVDTTLVATSWSTAPVIFNIKSIAFDFGTPQVRKWVTGIVFKSENKSNLSVQITSNNDDSSSYKQLKEIRFRDNCVWGDPERIWNDPAPEWGFTGLIIAKRRMPAGTLRCSYKQIVITNAFTNIFKSDSYCPASVDSVAKIATLTNPSTFDFPADSVGYSITFNADNYTNNYPILSQTADTVTYQDHLNLSSTSASDKWLIRGTPKKEVLSLLSYSLFYMPLTTTQPAYTGLPADTGVNT